jgi:uncharacterized membrane protein
MKGLDGLSRVIRHLWWDASDSHRWLTADAAKRLADQVAASECRHTGEIRLCVEASLPFHLWWPLPTEERMPSLVRSRALWWFGQLGVWDTGDNNGVLVYVLLSERSLEIVADRGISQRVPTAAWSAVLSTLQQDMASGSVEQGLVAAIDALDRLMCQHYPRKAEVPRRNELPDAVHVC